MFPWQQNKMLKTSVIVCMSFYISYLQIGNHKSFLLVNQSTDSTDGSVVSGWENDLKQDLELFQFTLNFQ